MHIPNPLCILLKWYHKTPRKARKNPYFMGFRAYFLPFVLHLPKRRYMLPLRLPSLLLLVHLRTPSPMGLHPNAYIPCTCLQRLLPQSFILETSYPSAPIFTHLCAIKNLHAIPPYKQRFIAREVCHVSSFILY